MESAVNIAAYIASRYQREYGAPIDEMKLHKLLYFSQREALIQLGEPLFAEQFRAWKYGPVLVEIRGRYKLGLLGSDYCLPERLLPVFNKVFAQYAGKNSWSLSRLTHGEYSWQNARIGLGPVDSGERLISTQDIRQDADRVKLRRYMLDRMSVQNPYS